MKYSAQEITVALGGRWQGRYGMARCPCHDDKTASLKISDKPDKNGNGKRIDLHCFSGCDWKDLKAELVKRGLLEPWRPAGALPRRHQLAHEAWDANKIAEQAMLAKAKQQLEDDERKRIGRALKLWAQSVPMEGTLAGTYLRYHRGLEFLDGQLDHCLKYHKGKHMIVALMTEPRSGEACGVQRIFLDDLGRKIERKMLGKAGICRISPDEDVLEGLHIAEGIEDAIACYVEDVRPVWATVSASMMMKFPVLEGIDALTIFPDPDDTGQDAASECAARWIEANREVRILRLEPRPA